MLPGKCAVCSSTGARCGSLRGHWGAVLVGCIFLQGVCYDAMIGFDKENHAGNTLMFTPSDKQCCRERAPRPFSGKGTRSWEETELGQLTSTGQKDTAYQMTSSGKRLQHDESSSCFLLLIGHCLGGAEPLLLHHFLHTFIYICVCVCVRASITSVLFSTFGKRFLSTYEFLLLFFSPIILSPIPPGRGE